MTVNVLVFVLRVVFFHLIVYVVTRYMYDAVRRDFALSASFVLECFDGSEVTTREGNDLVVLKENCVVEEIKEVEFRSRRGKFIYIRTYNSIGLQLISVLCIHPEFYFGGARSKGFATLRNVSKLQFFDKIGQAKCVGFRLYSAI